MSIELTVKKVDSVLKTLPVGFYLGTKAMVVLDPTSRTSFANPIDNEIHIAFKNVQDVFNHSPLPEDIGPDELEQFVRTILYHEVSHLLLTGRMPGGMSKVLNVFEDERIETLLASFYHNVNFKKVVFQLNNWKPGVVPEDPFQYFYQIVRFRIGPEKFLRRVSEIIRRFSEVDALTNDRVKREYVEAVENFYNEVIEDFPKMKAATGGKSDDSEDEDKSEDGVGTGESKGDGSELEEDEGSSGSAEGDKSESGEDGTISAGDEDPDGDEAESEVAAAVRKAIEQVAIDDCSKKFSPEEIHKAVEKMLAGDIDHKAVTDMQTRLERIILRATKKRQFAAKFAEGYAGKINPRSVATRTDYRWLTHRNDMGNLSMGGRVHLNLWVDVSGSFRESEGKMNQLLKALNLFEKAHSKEFSFSVITINEYVKVHERNIPIHVAGGNDFGDDALEAWKVVSKNFAGRTVYNIAVWDGDMVTDHCLSDSSWKAIGARTTTYERAIVDEIRKSLRLLDNPQSLIVSSVSNQCYLDLGCKSAKKVYITGDYCEEFIDQLFNLLDRVIS